MSFRIKSHRTRRFDICFLISIMLFISSCIEIHAFFRVKEDGSGYGKITYVISQGIYSAPDDYQLAINEDKLAETIAQKEGVKVIKTGSSYEEGNLVRVWAEFEFDDITKISDPFIKYFFEDLGNGLKELRINYRVRGQLHKREVFINMFKDLVSTLEVEVEGKIKSANGKILSKNRVKWEIPATEVVGQDYTGTFIVSFETEGKRKRKEGRWGFLSGLLSRIRDALF